MREIPLTQGKVALVDDEDYERVSRLSWRARRDKKTWYAETGSAEQAIFMHTFILGLSAGPETDHKDGNGLNNRRENIRPATRSNNCMNRKGWSKNGFKGVYRVTNSSRWGARIQAAGRMIQIGCYDSPEAAARAYDIAALRYHGEFARLNFLEAL
jgi:hypothetical protein